MSTPQLLVVCTANRARSPLGEALARRWFEQRGVSATVGSAGTHAEWGAGPTVQTEEAAARLGLDVSAHRSRPLDPDVVRGVDLVLTMERSHALEVGHRYPELVDVTFTLGELADLAPVHPREAGQTTEEWIDAMSRGRPFAQMFSLTDYGDIADPVGRSARRHRKTAGQISDALEVVLGAMTSAPGARGAARG